jgi:acylphosphatase
MRECRKFRVEGRVQGVWFRESTRQQADRLGIIWFRESTRQQADRLGIIGHAINCPDGSVEVLACGKAEALDSLAEWLRHGPPMARVSSVISATSVED